MAGITMQDVMDGERRAAETTGKPIIVIGSSNPSTPKYPAKYKSSEGKQWDGFSEHPQVDSGLGFTCDEEVLELVKAFNQWNIKTSISCQGPWGNWMVARAFISFTADTNENLMKFCVGLREYLWKKHSRADEQYPEHTNENFGWNCEVNADNYFRPRSSVLSASITVVREDIPKLIEAVGAVISELSQEV